MGVLDLNGFWTGISRIISTFYVVALHFKPLTPHFYVNFGYYFFYINLGLLNRDASGFSGCGFGWGK